MAFKLNIKNIGKLTDAKIDIGQFTVLAGPNNTGKSFVSKILYSIFDAMNANHAEVHINNLTNSLFSELNSLEGRSRKVDVLLSPLNEEIIALYDMVVESPVGDLEKLDEIISDLVERVGNMRAMLPDTRVSIESLEQDRSKKGSSQRDLFPEYNLNGIELSLGELEEGLVNINAKEFIIAGIEYKIRENLIGNFQVPKLSDLTGKENTPSEVDINNFGKFEFSNGEIRFEIDSVGVRRLQQYSKVIYLESPFYWKLKNAFEDLHIHPRYSRSRRKQVSGVPGYFYDLVSALKHGYTDDVDFPDLYEKLTGKDVIGGKIAISESGNLSFQENGRSFSLPVTATGVANLGTLALLIEQKVLDKDSFLFIDEPEAHLHPAWQVVMAESLFELAKGGVNVVIATHSADILKWLEVHVKKNPDDESLIALNKFPADRNEINEQDFDEKMASIKQELTKPFADLYMAGL